MRKVSGGIVGVLAMLGIVAGLGMSVFGLAHGRDSFIYQGGRIFMGSLLSAALLLVCRALGKHRDAQAKLDELDGERQRLYAARAALDLEVARLCRESEVNDRKRDEKARLERERDRQELEAERAAMYLDLEERTADIRAQAYARGIDHCERGFMDDPEGIVIHLPRKAAGKGASADTPRAREH